MKSIALSLFLLLAACASPAQLEEQRQTQLEQDRIQCIQYGLRPNTEAFANCRKELDLVRRQPVYYADPYPRFGVGYGRGFGSSYGVGYSRYAW